MAQYLVTGGAGFIGSHLAEELVRRGVAFREAHEVVGEVVRLAESQGADPDGLDPQQLADVHPALDPTVADLLDPHAAAERRDGVNATATTSVRAQLAHARTAAAVNLGSR